MTIDKLVYALKELQDAGFGGKNVLVSSDPEGNDYGDLGVVLSIDTPAKTNYIVFYPIETLSFDKVYGKK